MAAAVGSQNASGYQLATGEPVMPIGGFNGSDPSPTLAQFQQYVAEGRSTTSSAAAASAAAVAAASTGGSSSSSQIAAWVAANFTAQTVGGVTVYDLTRDPSRPMTRRFEPAQAAPAPREPPVPAFGRRLRTLIGRATASPIFRAKRRGRP